MLGMAGEKHIHHPGTEFISNPEARKEVLEAVSKGVSPGKAMAALGYANVMRDWQLAGETGKWRGGGANVRPESLVVIREFLEQLEQARAQGHQRLIEIVSDAAGRVNEKTGLVDWQPAKFLLTHGESRAEFYPHQEPQTVTLNATIAGPEFREAKDLSTEDLIEGLDDPGWAALLGEGKVIDG